MLLELGKTLLRALLLFGLIGALAFWIPQMIVVYGVPTNVIYVVLLGVSIVGFLIWFIIGKSAYWVTYRLILLPFRKFMKKRLYLLRPRERPQKTFVSYLIEVIDDSFLPMLFVYGLLNIIAQNVPSEAIEPGVLLLYILASTPLAGLFVPVLKVLLDSDITLVDLDDRKIEPIGVKVLTYVKSIAGLTAIYSFLSTIISLTGRIEVAINVMLNVFSLTYPSIIIILLLYNKFHDGFVEKLNMRLRQELKYVDVIITAQPKGTIGTIKLVEEKEIILPSWYSPEQQTSPTNQQQSNVPVPPIDNTSRDRYDYSSQDEN